ncbi:MAG: hypothetical protein ABGZ35_15570 [Planctomycetaceae bacterium]
MSAAHANLTHLLIEAGAMMRVARLIPGVRRKTKVWTRQKQPVYNAGCS